MACIPMGFNFGLNAGDTRMKRKFRWLLKIQGVSADGIDALPPQKGARPNVSFREIEAQHVTETVYFPGKPEWKPINLTLYETNAGEHPVWRWIKSLYDPRAGTWNPSCNGFKKPEARLELYDGCGEVLETWVYENVWVQSAEFGDLDMSSPDVVTCDLTLRYDRAYIEDAI
mgnify:CR=1 FL=1